MKKTGVTINLDQNVLWEIERVYEVEKTSYWWTKPQLKIIRDEYKNEVMMEGVRNLVKARIQQEEIDPEIIEKRLEEVMRMDHGSIANFLQSIPTKPQQLSPPYNSKVAHSNDSGSDSDSESDSDSDSDSDSSSSESSSSSSEKEEVEDDDLDEPENSLNIATKSESLPTNDRDDDDSDDDDSNDDDDDSSSSSSSSSDSDNEDNPIGSQTKQHDDIEQTAKIDSSDVASDDDDSSSSSSSSSDSDDEDNSIGRHKKKHDNIEQTAKIEIQFDLKRVNGNSGKSRFKQGALAVVAIDRLKKLVKREAPLPTSMNKVLSSSTRLMQMYLPSDDEIEDELDSSDDDSDCEDAVPSCPVCLDLVDPTQQRKVILLRRMLCKECYFSYYIYREEKDKTDGNESKSSEHSDEIQQKSGNSGFNAKRDVQILSSMKRCISSTEKSPMLPELPMPTRLKSPLLRDNFFIKSDKKSDGDVQAAAVRPKRYS